MYVTKEELADIVSQYLDRYRKIVAWYSQFFTFEAKVKMDDINYAPYTLLNDSNSYDEGIILVRFKYLNKPKLHELIDYELYGLDDIIKKDLRVASITWAEAVYLYDLKLITAPGLDYDCDEFYGDNRKLYFDMLSSYYKFNYVAYIPTNVPMNTETYLRYFKEISS